MTLQRFDSKIRNKEEAEEAFGLPVIGEIPGLPRSEQDRTTVISFDAPRSPTAEAYRSLRSSLVFVGHTAPPTDERLPSEYAQRRRAGRRPPEPDRKAQVILVTSPGPGEGKTTSAANLAAVLAETGYSVLAINCDFRKPRLHKYLGAQDIPRKVVETAIPGVRTITDVVTDSSRLNPAEVVAAQRKVIESARELFDIIVLDTAPLLATNDATDLLGEADLVVVCCRAGKTTRDGAERTVEALKRHEAPVAGCVIVGSDEGPAASYYYYYGDRDADGPASNGSGADRRRPRDRTGRGRRRHRRRWLTGPLRVDWQRHPHNLTRQVPDGWLVLARAPPRHPVLLSGSAAALWEALDQPSPADLHRGDHLRTDTSGDPDQIRIDVEPALAELVELGVVEAVEP